MKLVHISDLHLGRSLKQTDLLEDQRYMLMEQILPVIRSRKADAVLISGDIFDTFNPSFGAMSLLDEFLVEVHKSNAKIFMIGGNHDSGIRVDYHSRILQESGCYFCGSYSGTIEKHVLSDEYGPVNFYLLPYLNPDLVRNFHKEELDSKASFDEAVRFVLSKAGLNPKERNVILSHQYVTGSNRATSDTPPLVGSGSESDQVRIEWYSGFDYVALGHIHKHYSLMDGHAVYPGSLLPYAHDESSKRVVSFVELKDKGDFHQEDIPVKLLHEIRTYTGTSDEILSLPDDREHFVYVVFTDEKGSPTLTYQLQQKFPYFLGSERRWKNTENSLSELESYRPNSNPLETIRKFYKAATGQELDEKEIEIVEEILKECEEEDNEAD